MDAAMATSWLVAAGAVGAILLGTARLWQAQKAARKADEQKRKEEREADEQKRVAERKEQDRRHEANQKKFEAIMTGMARLTTSVEGMRLAREEDRKENKAEFTAIRAEIHTLQIKVDGMNVRLTRIGERFDAFRDLMLANPPQHQSPT